MLTIRYVDRETGEAPGTYQTIALVWLEYLQAWANNEGWDVEVLGYQPSA